MQKSEGILSLLIEHAEKIDSRFAAKDYQYEKMKEKRESIVECFSYLDLCEESCELSYVQCLWSFRQYLRDVGKQLQINEQLAHLPSTPLQTPQNALLKLQQHLIGGFIADLTNPVHEKSDLNIDFKADVPDEWLMQWKFAMQWEGKSDPKQGNFMRIMKMFFALFFLLHVGIYFILDPKFNMQYIVYWFVFSTFFSLVVCSSFFEKNEKTNKIRNLMLHVGWGENRGIQLFQNKK